MKWKDTDIIMLRKKAIKGNTCNIKLFYAIEEITSES